MRSLCRARWLVWMIPLGVLAAVQPGTGAAAGPPAVGQEAPTFAVPDARGKTIDLASYRGKGPVVLVFYRGYF